MQVRWHFLLLFEGFARHEMKKPIITVCRYIGAVWKTKNDE